MKYNTAGSPVAKISPWDGTNTRTVRIGYADSFNSTVGVSTYAYPTVFTDPAGTSLGDTSHSSTVKYRYDIGANVQATSPAPAGQTYGKTTKREYDDKGRIERDSVFVNTTEKAYTRYEYETNGVQSKSYSPAVDVDGDGNIAEDEVLSESWSDGAGRVYRSRTEHPGSTGGWSATRVEYDILGRAKSQSVPTEVSVSGSTWTPAGDDLAQGWLWTHQKYDWMGRVVRKINTDGIDQTALNDSDVLISYDGCGCAGGLVTTIEAERVSIPGTSSFARRKQKVYADILGRTFKTETYQWDGSTKYSTTEKLFDGRDRAVKVIQTDNTSTATPQTFQETLATFDGHGRMATSHRPEQRDGSTLKYTTYSYNPDDSILSLTDARGAVTNFEYNSIGLLTEKSWTVPGGSGIADPTDVVLSYDNLGNRTSMTDGMGIVNYEYNSLSQMTVEARNFSDTLTNEPGTGIYRIDYTYALTGELMTLTEPFGEVINYSYDKMGRSTSVDPATAYGDLPQNNAAISGLQYRAFGSLKQADYGNGTQASFTYNNRLQPITYRLVNTANSQILFGKDYFYTTGSGDGNDGLIKRSVHYDDTIAVPTSKNRTNQYDSLGRISRSDAGDTSGLPSSWSASGLTNGQFQQKFEYDAFGNVVKIDDRDFNYNVTGCVGCPRMLSHTETIANNRTTSSTSCADGCTSETVFEHDFDGRLTKRGNEIYQYNAIGLRTVTDLPNTTSDPSYAFDGEGKLSRLSENGTVKTYYISSTLLNSTVLELTSTGALEKSYILSPAGMRIASEKNGELTLLHNEPSWATEYGLKTDRTNVSASEFDPMGAARANGGYAEGGACGTNCPSPYNPPGGIDGLERLTSMRNAEWLKYRMFSLMQLNIRQVGWNDRMPRTPGGPPRIIPPGGPRPAPTGQFDDEFHGLDWDPSRAEGSVTPVYGYDFLDLGIWLPRGRLGHQFVIWFMPHEKRIVDRIVDIVTFAAQSKECAEAFKSVGAVPIGEQAGNTTIVTQSLFGVPAFDSFWAPQDDGKFANALRKRLAQETSIFGVVGPSDITQEGEYMGRRYIGLTQTGAKESKFTLGTTIIHSFLHAGGVSKYEGWFKSSANDLNISDEKHAEIIEKCKKK